MAYQNYSQVQLMDSAKPVSVQFFEKQFLHRDNVIGHSCLECVFPCICEGANKYVIIQLDENDNPQQQLAYISEQSGCFSRFCCQCFRGFKMNITSDKDPELQIFGEKGCGCTCTPVMCFQFNWYLPCINGLPVCRPSIAVSSSNDLIGRVHNPFRICGRSGCRCLPFDEIDIIDSNSNMKYMVSASCCQTGQLCRCCAGNKIQWAILDAQKGRITNVYNGCYKEVCTKEDKFVIEFPSQANYNEKILLIYAAVMIDFDIFEDTCCHLA